MKTLLCQRFPHAVLCTFFTFQHSSADTAQHYSRASVAISFTQIKMQTQKILSIRSLHIEKYR